MTLEGLIRRISNWIPPLGKWLWLQHQEIGKGCRISSDVIWNWRSAGTLVIGEQCEIESGVVIAPSGGSIVIGDNTYVGHYSILYGHGGLTIGANVLISSHCVLTASNHNFARLDLPIRSQGETMLGICIGDDVWLGNGVRVLDGVTIGKGSVIGAGAVVTASVPANSVAYGVPARVIRERASRK